MGPSKNRKSAQPVGGGGAIRWLVIVLIGVNPPVDQVGNFLHKGQVITTEAVGGLSRIVGVFVEAAERDKMPGAGDGRAVHPDRGFDRAGADFEGGLVVHDGCGAWRRWQSIAIHCSPGLSTLAPSPPTSAKPSSKKTSPPSTNV